MRLYLLGVLTGFLLVPVGKAVRWIVEMERIRRRTHTWLATSPHTVPASVVQQDYRQVVLSDALRHDILEAMGNAGF
jgi:hypothetical protein